jgi:hypothetical protein
MPGYSVSATMTVFFDGQFWVAYYERDGENGFEVARHVFGPEPSLPQIAELVAGKEWLGLEFLPGGEGNAPPMTVGTNPKRAQREVARLLRSPRRATQAQESTRLALEQSAAERAVSRREQAQTDAADRREREVAKRKARKRGR